MSAPWSNAPAFSIRAQLDIEIRDGTIHFRGELDALTRALLEEETCRLIDQGERQLVVDLADVSFVSASAMDALVGIAGRLAAVGGWLELRNPIGMVREVLHVCGLTRFLRHGEW